MTETSQIAKKILNSMDISFQEKRRILDTLKRTNYYMTGRKTIQSLSKEKQMFALLLSEMTYEVISKSNEEAGREDDRTADISAVMSILLTGYDWRRSEELIERIKFKLRNIF